MDDTEKLITQDTQDEDKQNRSKTQYLLDTAMRKQTHVFHLSLEIRIFWVEYNHLSLKFMKLDIKR